MKPVIILVAALAQTPPQQWSAERVLRIGSIDEPGTALSHVTSISIDPRGSVYVAQPQDQHIKVFDASGQPRGIIGRRREGPGEFSDLSTMSWRADSLFVTDVGCSARVFDTAGQFLAIVAAVARCTATVAP